MRTEINVFCQKDRCQDPATTKTREMIGEDKMYHNVDTGAQARLYTCPVCNDSVTVTFKMLVN